MSLSASPIDRDRLSPDEEARPRIGGRSARVLDLVERASIVGLFVWLAVRLAPSLEPLSAGYLVSEGLVALFILFRRGVKDLDVSPYGVAVAYLGTLMALLTSSQGPQLAPYAVCAAVMLLGFTVSLGGKLMLNRRFGVIPANRGVQIYGPYRFVRHPIYFGYVASELGFLLSHASMWNFIVLGGAWTAQVLRIVAEERVLSRDPEYRAYMAKVRWRLLPGVF